MINLYLILNSLYQVIFFPLCLKANINAYILILINIYYPTGLKLFYSIYTLYNPSLLWQRYEILRLISVLTIQLMSFASEEFFFEIH